MENKEKVTLLDVRNQREWLQTGVIPGSLMIEMQNIPSQLQNGFSFEGKEPVIVICKSGTRSAKVTEFLINQFGIEAYNLEGGIIAWNRIGEQFEKI